MLDPATPVFNEVAYQRPGDSGGGLPQNDTETVARLDYNMSSKTQIYGRYALEKGDLITLRELRRRTRHTARLVDVYWWLLRCEADKARMEKLRKRKHQKPA